MNRFWAVAAAAVTSGLLITPGTALAATTTVTAGRTSPSGHPPAPDVTPPTTPGRLQPLPTPFGKIGFGWAPSTDDRGVARYEVFLDGRLIATTTGTSYVFPPPTSAKWVFGVRAVDRAGNPSAFSTYTSGYPADTVPPSTPVITFDPVTGLPTYFGATWTAAADDVTVAGYEVTVNGVTTRTSATRVLAPFKVPGVWSLTVRAFDPSGNLSAPATFTVVLDPPAH